MVQTALKTQPRDQVYYPAVMTKQLTIRGVSAEVKERLEMLSRSRGQSVNATVLEILEAAVGDGERRHEFFLHATWGREDLADFEKALAVQRSTDDPCRVQEAEAREEGLYGAYDLLAADAAGSDVESYFAIQAETLLDE